MQGVQGAGDDCPGPMVTTAPTRGMLYRSSQIQETLRCEYVVGWIEQGRGHAGREE